MPAPSRAQRRRANMQKQASGLPQPSALPRQTQPLDTDPSFTGETLLLDSQSTVEAAPTGAMPNYGSRPARQMRQTRQVVNRPVPAALAPIDYAEDYRHARRDLLRIFIWSALLFGAMIAIRLTGIL